MKYKIETITIFVLFLVALISFPKFTGAQETIQRKVEKATLQIHIEYSDTGDASLIVKKIKSETYEPEEMARLLSHWFS
ncbi:MAG: hypothetical protein JSV31_17190 [Desulfobacterales bacterium]|nr:MAG: hypothetical protein JSV31_17190 [Desulfobacterales bacterium]